MQAFFVSAFVVALGEIGDKTQLLAILLATRFKQPAPIILGILAATVCNHVLAATVGYLVSGLLSGTWFRIAVGASFIAMAGWVLIPDKADEEEMRHRPGAGVFLTTAIAFFLVEMGDKTQVATVALAARFHNILVVAAGTTCGMLLADVPAVFLGEAATKVIPLKYVRIGTSVIFFALGALAIADALGMKLRV
jgi:putative Ca2+/H+ antiporter (TMEM165/GDT1 family)